MTKPIAPCPLCGEDDHDQKDCYLLGDTATYLGRLAPRPPGVDDEPGEPKGSPSLPKTQFEELFGKGAEPSLIDAIDDEDYSVEERQLAVEILADLKHIDALSPEDRDTLDGIALRMATAPAKKPARVDPPKAVRPAGVHTWQEMQEEGDEDAPKWVDSDPFTSVYK